MHTFLSSVALIGMLLNTSSTTASGQTEEPIPVMSAENIRLADNIIANYEKYRALFKSKSKESPSEDDTARKTAVTEIKEAEVTAYSSTPDQTDDDPFIMATGKYVYDGAIAANFLPFGTKVRFPEIYGDKIFTVEDRMHRRFSDRIDIWMETKREAEIFGIKKLQYEIVEEKEPSDEKIIAMK